MKRITLFLSILLSTTFISKTFALSYFYYTPASNLITNEQELRIHFSYDLQGYEETNFIVRPVLSNGLVSIYDQDSDIWTSQADLWTSMPKLHETMKLQFDFNGSSDLYFQIQNTTNAQIYETQKEIIWGKGSYTGYLDTLNKNIKMYALKQESLDRLSQKSDPIITNSKKRAGLFAKVIKYIGEII